MPIPERSHTRLSLRDPAAILGCLLGGAVGDALGAPVEFLAWEQIRQQFGECGLRASHFLGLIHGSDAIPACWLDKLELREVIEQVARDLSEVPACYRGGASDAEEAIRGRYPGW